MARTNDDSFSGPRSNEVIGFRIHPIQIHEALTPAEPSLFYFEFQARLVVNSGDRQDGDQLISWSSLALKLDMLLGSPAEARERMSGALDAVLIGKLEAVEAAFIVDAILEPSTDMASDIPTVGRALRMNVDIDLAVESIPDLDDNDDNYDVFMLTDAEAAELYGFRNRDGHSAGVRFVPASDESIAGLERIRVEVTEKECRICLEDLSVGSEATLLPCSHQYHGECILKWLKTSKFCPLCRFELY